MKKNTCNSSACGTDDGNFFFFFYSRVVRRKISAEHNRGTFRSVHLNWDAFPFRARYTGRRSRSKKYPFQLFLYIIFQKTTNSFVILFQWCFVSGSSQWRVRKYIFGCTRTSGLYFNTNEFPSLRSAHCKLIHTLFTFYPHTCSHFVQLSEFRFERVLSQSCIKAG